MWLRSWHMSNAFPLLLLDLYISLLFISNWGIVTQWTRTSQILLCWLTKDLHVFIYVCSPICDVIGMYHTVQGFLDVLKSCKLRSTCMCDSVFYWVSLFPNPCLKILNFISGRYLERFTPEFRYDLSWSDPAILSYDIYLDCNSSVLEGHIR